MTIDKDFKKLVRERMAKTGESYTAALHHLRGGSTSTSADDLVDDDTVYTIEVDGRWSARNPSHPNSVGHGPTKRRAWLEMFSRQLDETFKRHPTNVLTLIEPRTGAWTARATENLALLGEGRSEHEATDNLMRKLPTDPQRRWPEDRFTRTVTFKEHADGRWSARSDTSEELMGWGSHRNEAEENLIQAEYHRDAMNDVPEEYGYYKDDD
jgi:hypothetical protein